MFSSLSDIQRDIVFNKTGKCVVRACPGSGKTYTLAARLAHKIRNWEKKHQGVAVLSFTNIAKDEIINQLYSQWGIKIGYPHFVGTIDSFINNFIFLPWGHLLMGCASRPMLVGEPHCQWHHPSGRGIAAYYPGFDAYSFDLSDNLIKTGSINDRRIPCGNQDITNTTGGHKTNMISAKKELFQRGYATQQDSIYFSCKLLENYEIIPKLLSQRFPEMLIDEAQDTSDKHMAIIDSLIQNGLNEIILVGDPDQAIYEWNTADPSLLTNKFREWEENSTILNECRRSSQNICSFVFPLSSLTTPAVSVSEHKDHSHIPHIVVYNPEDTSNIHETIKSFLDECTNHHIPASPAHIAVLARTWAMHDKIAGTNIPFGARQVIWLREDYYTRHFALGKYCLDNGLNVKGFQQLQLGVFKLSKKCQTFSEDEFSRWLEAQGGETALRKALLRLLDYFPMTNQMRLKEWIQHVNNNFANAEKSVVLRLDPNISSEIKFEDAFREGNNASDKEYCLSTVHGIKGTTFDATLLFLSNKGGGALYTNLLAATSKGNALAEELRIIYVAITRPRKILTIAVPSSEQKSIWENFFLGVR